MKRRGFIYSAVAAMVAMFAPKAQATSFHRPPKPKAPSPGQVWESPHGIVVVGQPLSREYIFTSGKDWWYLYWPHLTVSAPGPVCHAGWIHSDRSGVVVSEAIMSWKYMGHVCQLAPHDKC